MERIRGDSFILIYRDKRRHWIVRPGDTPRLHTHLGILDCMALVGREFGISAKTTLGDELYILKPTVEDMIMKFSRKTQIIYPKDLAMILLRCGIHSGSRVFEAGTGSGSATAAMAYMTVPGGHVYSYDVNESFQLVAMRNIERLGLQNQVTFRLKDAKLGIEETDLSAALIDVGDPWELLHSVRTSLEPSGMLAAVTPTTNQAERLVEEMKAQSFVRVETIEILVRNIEARAGMTRPSNRMVGHTAYVNFGMKTL